MSYGFIGNQDLSMWLRLWWDNRRERSEFLSIELNVVGKWILECSWNLIINNNEWGRGESKKKLTEQSRNFKKFHTLFTAKRVPFFLIFCFFPLRFYLLSNELYFYSFSYQHLVLNVLFYRKCYSYRTSSIF